MKKYRYRYNADEIPYKDFENLGLPKLELIEKLGRDGLSRLMAGKRTALYLINGKDDQKNEFSGMAKFSLYSCGNVTKLNIHPVRKEIENSLGLSDEDIDKLIKDDVISKKINGERFIIQLDKETNELLIAATKYIKIPSHICGVLMNSEKKEQLRKARNVFLKKTGEENLIIKIDLDNINGFKFVK